MIQDTRARRACGAARAALLALSLAATASRATATVTATATPTPTPTPTPEIGAGIETTLPLRMQVGRFGEVQVFRPSGAPTAVTLLISGEEGWDPTLRALAASLVGHGTVVVGVDGERYVATLNQARGGCQYLAGEFEELSHAVQQRLGLDGYLLPVLAGRGDGATLAALVLEQSPKGTYAGLLSIAFRPGLALRVAPCGSNGLAWRPRESAAPTARGGAPAAAPADISQVGIELLPRADRSTPWVMLHEAADTRFALADAQHYARASGATELVRLDGGGTDRAALGAAWLAAQQALAARGSARIPTPAALRDLPLHEVPAEPRAAADDAFAVLLTGDGGWAGLDQDVSAALARDGIPVVALNSLKYFWKRRDPDLAAQDLQRIVARYGEAWRRHGVLLIGYSFGADVLPFLYRRLPEPTRASVRSVTLLAPSTHADFEFHLSDWLPGPSGPGAATRPEIERMGAARVLCLHPSEEGESPCDGARLPGLATLSLDGGHHFNGDYAGLAARILEFARKVPRAAPRH